MSRAKAEQKAAERERATQATQLEDLRSQHAAEQEGAADVAGNADEIARLEAEAAELEQEVGAARQAMHAFTIHHMSCPPQHLMSL